MRTVCQTICATTQVQLQFHFAMSKIRRTRNSGPADVHSAGQSVNNDWVIIHKGQRFRPVPEIPADAPTAQSFKAGQHVEVRIDSGVDSSSSDSEDDDDGAASASNSYYASAIVTRNSLGGSDAEVHLQWYYKYNEMTPNMAIPRSVAKLMFLSNREDTVAAECIVRVHAKWVAREKVADHLYDADSKKLVNTYTQVLEYMAARNHASATLAMLSTDLQTNASVYTKAACDAVRSCLNIPDMASGAAHESMACCACYGPLFVGDNLARLITNLHEQY